MSTVVEDQRIFIRDAAKMLGRLPATLRSWEYNHMLPKELMPHRTEAGWRYWTPEQIKAIKKWLVDADIRPGKGLPHYKPTRAQIAQHISRVGPKRRADKRETAGT